MNFLKKLAPSVFNGALTQTRLLISAVVLLALFLIWEAVAKTCAHATNQEVLLQPRLMGFRGIDKPIGDYKPKLSQNLSFGASRGERTFITLRLETDRCVQIKLNDFTQGNATSVALAHQLYRIETFEIKESSYRDAIRGDILDPLIPIEKTDEICPNTANRQAPIWLLLDLSIPLNMARGDYSSSIALGPDIAMSIHLRIWKMAMIEKTEFRLYAGLNSWFTHLGHFGKWDPTGGHLNKEYLDTIDGLNINAFESWSANPIVIKDERGRPLLDVENYPSKEESFIHTYASHLKEGMINMPNVFEIPIDTSPQVYLTAIENTIHRYGWEERAFVYLWDEPKPEDFVKVIERAALVREYAPSLKTLVTIHYVPELEPYVDIWVPVINQFDAQGFPKPDVYRRLQEEGKQFWLYISCMSHGCESDEDAGTPDLMIDRPIASIRALGALAQKYRADALLYWRLNHAYSTFPSRDTWSDQWYFSGNGEGTLLYPGRPGIQGLDRHQPILSLRLMAVAETLNDMWYFNEMNRLRVKPAWWPAALKELSPSPVSWESSLEKYVNLYEKIGNYLDQ
jgi:hypothetical protein